MRSRSRIHQRIFKRAFSSSSPSVSSLFDIPEHVSYLNCAYLSPLSRDVAAAGIDGFARKVQPWRITKPDFYDDTSKVRELFAKVIEAQSSSISIIPSASYGAATAAKNINVEKGQRIVILGEEHASNRLVWQTKARETGADLVIVNPPADNSAQTWTDIICEAITPNTAVFAGVHCYWADGTLLDIKRIADHCTANSTCLVIDGTQSIGALPLPSGVLTQIDFLIAPAYKWLMCPYGIGFMYSNEKYHRHGVPLEHHGFNRSHEELIWGAKPGVRDRVDSVGNDANLFEIDGVLNETFQDGAIRFDVGEPSNFCSVPAAVVALDLLIQWGGPVEISKNLLTLTSAVASEAAIRGFEMPTSRAPHLIGIRLPQGQNWPQDTAQKLAEKSVYVSQRGKSLRIAPHLYNREVDIKRLFTAIDELELVEEKGSTVPPFVPKQQQQQQPTTTEVLQPSPKLMSLIHSSEDFKDVDEAFVEMIEKEERIDAPCLCLLLTRIIQTLKSESDVRSNIQQMLPRILSLAKSSAFHLRETDADNLCETVIEIGDRWDVITLLQLSPTYLPSFRQDQYESLLNGPCLKNHVEKMHVPLHQTVLQAIHLMKANSIHQQPSTEFPDYVCTSEVQALRVIEEELKGMNVNDTTANRFILKLSQSEYF